MRASRTIPALALWLAGALGAQQASRLEPVTGLRDNGTGFHALVGARVVTAPGQAIDSATVVIRNGVITAVGDGALNTETGQRIPLSVKKGDKVIFSSYAGTEVKINDTELLIMSEDDILAVID